MKKTIIVLALVLAIIPAMAFADFQIGVVGLYPSTPIGFLDSSTNISASDLAYGLESRLKIWIFQGAISAFYAPAIETVYMYTDVGLALDLLFVRIGAGVGPVIAADTQGGGTTSLGWNLKTTFDINLGNLGLGVILYSPMADLSDLSYILQNYADNSYVAVTLMFRLF
jgi:hypothetical protein